MEHHSHSTIHVINDVPDQLDVVAYTLRQGGFQVATAMSGREGLKMARRQIPDLIISDVSMPEMDGIELCRRIRADHRLSTVPVMLVTALRKDTDSVLQGLQAGADDYLEAPFEPMRLVAKVARLIERKRTDDALREREKYYRILIENASDLISILRVDGTMRYQSPSLGRLLGYEPDDLLDKSVMDFIHLDDKDEALLCFGNSLRSPAGKVEFEVRFMHKNGSWRYFVCTLTNLLDDPTIKGIVSNAFDITKHKSYEAAIRNSDERMVTILEASRDGMLIEDDGIIVYVNKSYLQLLGYNKAEELLGKHISGILPPDEAEPIAYYGRREGKSAPSLYEFKLKRKDGMLVNVEGAVSTSTVGGRKYITTTIRDITERKQAEQELIISEMAKRRLAERQMAILNALPSHVCLLDGAGLILDVNLRWREFALKNKYTGSSSCIGSDYLAVCDKAVGESAEGAKAAADGIRAVISSKSKQFEMDYPCHSPEEQRWFKLMVAPIHDDASAGVVVMHVNITEGVLAKNALRDMTLELEAAIYAYRQVLGKSLDVICTVDEAGHFLQVSEASKEVWGYEPEELIGRRYIELVHPDDRDRTILAATAIMSGIATSDFDNRYLRKDGTVVDIMWSANWSESDKSMFCVARDVSQIKYAERALEHSAEQLRQSQKLESVGRLAGGIAHDFNNMLTAIQGYSELTLRRLEDDDPLRRNIEEILKAGERSASLTRQLLAFSRQQILQPVVLDLNVAITDTVKMLQRLIGEDIQLVAVINPKAGRVKADPGQISQIIMNLAVNARDAMPTGGKLTIETANATLNEEYTRQHVGVTPGEYVMLAICDTGTGMSAATQQHIFEPFFTTKEMGKGTGLGLATVYGIVKQSGGHIWIYSEMGVGSAFKIYLPRVAEEVEVEETKHPADSLLKGSETILLVEDEEMVRVLTCQILEECGYTVLQARSGAEALALCDEHDYHIDMLMTDVVMPQMGGRELAERFADIYPRMRILFTSGYTDDAVVRHGVIETGTNFIQKPFTPDGLAQKVREILDIHRE